MHSISRLFVILALALVISGPSWAAPDHSASTAIGAAADQAGASFLAGARRIARPLAVVGRTAVDGVAFVLLKGEQGVIWVAEEAVHGLQYVKEGARFILIQTARGVRWLALEALAAGEIILDAVCEVTELVIEDLAFVLIKVEQGFAFVAKKAVQSGRVIIRGVVHVAQKTAEGIVFVAEATANAIQSGLRWAADKALVLKIRARLAGALVAGPVGADSLAYFQSLSVSADASAHLRLLARAALNASEKFNAAYQH